MEEKAKYYSILKPLCLQWIKKIKSDNLSLEAIFQDILDNEAKWEAFFTLWTGWCQSKKRGLDNRFGLLMNLIIQECLRRMVSLGIFLFAYVLMLIIDVMFGCLAMLCCNTWKWFVMCYFVNVPRSPKLNQGTRVISVDR